MKIKLIKLVNDSHNTEINLRPRDNKLSLRQIKRAKKKLCGEKDCKYCNQIGIEEEQNGFRIELVSDPNGKVKYGILHLATSTERKEMSLCFRGPFFGGVSYFDK